MTVTAVGRRLDGLDRLRGFAVLCMVVDHVALFASADPLRVTVGRLALPLFFLIAGSLLSTRRPGRLAGVAVLGLVLPFLAPWIDSPNVLLWWAVGSLLVAGWGRLPLPFHGFDLVPVVVCVALLANGYLEPGGYPPAALIALMFLGRVIGPATLAGIGDRFPGWLAGLGRHALLVYVGHVLILTASAAVAVGL